MENSRAIFVSFHHFDFDFASELIKALNIAGFRVFSRKDATDSSRLIQAPVVLICILRPQYKYSEACTNELTNALAQSVPTLPVIRIPVPLADWPDDLTYLPIYSFPEQTNKDAYKDAIRGIITYLRNNYSWDLLTSPAEIYTSSLIHRLHTEIPLTDLMGIMDQDSSQISSVNASNKEALKLIAKSKSTPPIEYCSFEEILSTYPKIAISCSKFQYEDVMRSFIKWLFAGIYYSKSMPLIISASDWKSSKSIEYATGTFCAIPNVAAVEIIEICNIIFILDIQELSEGELVSFLSQTSSYYKNIPSLILCSTGQIVGTDELQRNDVQEFHLVVEQDTNFDTLKEYVDDLWDIGHERFPSITVNFDDLKCKLSKLAYEICINDWSLVNFSLTDHMSVSDPEFDVFDCAQKCGFISNSSRGARFTHSGLRDYFACLELQVNNNPPPLPFPSFTEDYQRIATGWDGPIKLYLSTLLDATEYMQKIIKIDPIFAVSSVSRISNNSEELFWEHVSSSLDTLKEIGDYRVVLAKNLAHTNIEKAAEILLSIMRDECSNLRLVATEALISLDYQLLPGLSHAIQNMDLESKASIINALRRMDSIATFTLIMLMSYNNHSVRKSAAWAAGEIRDKALVPMLMKLTSDSIREVSIEAINSLGRFRDVKAINLLHSIAISGNTHWRVHQAAARVLEKWKSLSGASNVAFLTKGMVSNINCLSKDDLELRNKTKTEGAIMGFSQDNLSLNNITSSNNSKSRWSMRRVIDVARKLLRLNYRSESSTSSAYVKRRLIDSKQSLTMIGEQEASAPVIHSQKLLQLVNDLVSGEWSKQEKAAYIIREYATKQDIITQEILAAELIKLLQSQNWLVRWAGVESLAWSKNMLAISELHKCLLDTKWKIRVAAIRAISEIGSSNSVVNISALLSDKNPIVREAAAEAMGVLGPENHINNLKNALYDHEAFVRLAAVEALGKISIETDTEELLLYALDDKDVHVRWAAANALVSAATTKSENRLIAKLNDSDGPYWEQRRICDIIAEILARFGTQQSQAALDNWRNNQAEL